MTSEAPVGSLVSASVFPLGGAVGVNLIKPISILPSPYLVSFSVGLLGVHVSVGLQAGNQINKKYFREISVWLFFFAFFAFLFRAISRTLWPLSCTSITNHAVCAGRLVCV